MDYYIGTIMMFAGNYAPAGWAFCDGKELSISQNQALYAVIGTIYGGNGKTTFALPDLRDRVPVGAGSSPSPTTGGQTDLGEKKGSNTVTLGPTNMPPHTHQLLVATQTANSAVAASDSHLTNTVTNPTVTVTDPEGNVKVEVQTPSMSFYNGVTTTTPIQGIEPSSYGSTSPISIVQPSLGVTYIICMQGEFPPKS
ncbi:Microcystin-dependent protein [Flexibacter flexilis DSM 6793]|uniref:Microcystin-dependent protein n=1 Tax=Flexibacter flexilis DSM 6793 TaxID=927664 RepID=A0A1I1NQ92_9BACT|nr:tail fiber protein [Flexibacter flexilis]SFC99697.1 Microcystin-dependent protein [Flexibacter flexilis DSM 6793]